MANPTWGNALVMPISRATTPPGAKGRQVVTLTRPQIDDKPMILPPAMGGGTIAHRELRRAPCGHLVRHGLTVRVSA